MSPPYNQAKRVFEGQFSSFLAMLHIVLRVATWSAMFWTMFWGRCQPSPPLPSHPLHFPFISVMVGYCPRANMHRVYIHVVIYTRLVFTLWGWIWVNAILHYTVSGGAVFENVHSRVKKLQFRNVVPVRTSFKVEHILSY